MAKKEEVQVGTYGRVVEIDTKTDLSYFTDPGDKVEIAVLKPNNVETTWAATIKDENAVLGDPDYGIITYTLQQGDLDEIGSYRLHARLTKVSPAMLVFGDQAVLKAARMYESRTD